MSVAKISHPKRISEAPNNADLSRPRLDINNFPYYIISTLTPITTMAPKRKRAKFAFDFEKLENFAREKASCGSPACFENFNTNAIQYYSNKRRHVGSVPMIKSILNLAEEMDLTIHEFRSLFIEAK